MSRETVTIGRSALSENDRLASAIRMKLQDRKIVTLNLVSSPGSGKTSLLERTIGALGNEFRIAVVAGDVQTDNDARRIAEAGCATALPIVTGGKCHLDAQMVTSSLEAIDLDSIDLLFIENVGNLVCPSSYDLGEDMKVALISTTEGDDKPLKYPAMFRRSSVMVINKIDLLEFSEFKLSRVKENARSLNGDLKFFEISCRTRSGLEEWFDWLRKLVRSKQNQVDGG